MKNKLFGIDIECYHNKTTVDFWRITGKKVGNITHRTYQIKSEEDYDRLFNLLPPENASSTFIHPKPDGLSIHWLLKE